MPTAVAAVGLFLVLAAQCSSHTSPLAVVPRAAAGLLLGKGRVGLRLRGGACGEFSDDGGGEADEAIPPGAEMMSEEEMRREMHDAGETMEEAVIQPLIRSSPLWNY